MNHADAAEKMLDAIERLGLRHLVVVEQEEGDISLKFTHIPDAVVVIHVGDYWMYEGVSCYFVNYHHTSGAFICSAGTPFVEQALFDLGMCFEAANNASPLDPA